MRALYRKISYSKLISMKRLLVYLSFLDLCRYPSYLSRLSFIFLIYLEDYCSYLRFATLIEWDWLTFIFCWSVLVLSSLSMFLMSLLILLMKSWQFRGAFSSMSESYFLINCSISITFENEVLYSYSRCLLVFLALLLRWINT